MRLRNHSKAGFTLLELIIVMFLITLILALSTVFFVSALSSSKLNATVRQMVTTIRHARELAQSTGKNQVIIIDMDSKVYSIEGRAEMSIPEGVNIVVMDNVKGEEIREGSYRIIFNAIGGFDGGRIILWNEKRRVYIDIDPIAGARITE